MVNEEIKKELIESYKEQPMELTPFQRVIYNAAIIAGITFFSTLSIAFPPRPENLWAAFIGASLSLLTQLKTITSISENEKPKRPLGMLI
jgi:hypothetical protein